MATTRLTVMGDVMGTPAYMPPEQAAGRIDQVGPLANVYSLGAILYELLSGQPPFSGTLAEVLAHVQSREPAPLGKLICSLHVDVATICRRAMAKEPADRYPSAEALAEDLERFRAGEAIHPARPQGHMKRLWRAVVRRPVVSTVIAVALAPDSSWPCADRAQSFAHRRVS